VGRAALILAAEISAAIGQLPSFIVWTTVPSIETV
jgi:hypothetical protein